MSSTRRTVVIGGLTYRLNRHGVPVRPKAQRAPCRQETADERASRLREYVDDKRLHPTLTQLR
jgi:hypothetical protein